VTDMGANKIRLNVNNKLNNLDLVELKFKVSSNNTRTSASVIVKAGADGIDFGTISATAANADGVTNNSNTLTFKTEGYPVNNLIAEITPKNVFAGETELFDYYFNFDIGADNEGADTFVIRTGDGYVPSSPATVSATVNGGPVPSTSILLGNDLVTTLTGAITAPGNYTVRIRFSCNTPAVSDTGKVFSSQVLRTGRNFGSNSVAGNADGNGANDQGVSAEDNLLVTVSNYITSVTAEISPNYANKNSQTMFSIYSKLVFEDEDSGINKLIVNFPTGYNFGSDSISNVKLYNALNEDLILINPLNYRIGEGPTNATGFDIITQSVIDKTSAISVLKIVFSAKSPNAVDAPVGKNFGLKVTNTLNDTRQITASEGNAFDGVSGNSMNVICGETKVDSYTLNLISSRNGFYKIEFGAEFSGLMDSGVTPVVKLVSESDTSREIDFVNNIFEFNKYSGTAYIPVNDINYFNNKVKVVFEVMKNMFGGDLSENTIENIHVNPSFISAIFKAPISNNAMTLLIKASKNITSGFNVRIEQQNSYPRNVTMARIDSEKNIYSGTYVVDLTKTGQAYIEVSGFDSDGIEGRDIAQFFVAGGGFNVNSAPVGNFTVSFDFDSNQENFIITEAEYEGSNPVINMASGIDGVDSDNSVELEVYPGGLYMWPEVKFNKSVGVSSEVIDFGSKTGLFREEDGKMKFVSKLSDKSFEINKAGKYFIAKDNKAPQINFESSIVEVLDNGSGIYKTEIELNGRKITISANGSNNQQLDLNSVLRGPGISGRQQQVTITTSDMLGNTINRVVNFVPTSIGNMKSVCYPNPASDYSIIKADGTILALKAVLSVYDSSGRLVFRTDITGMSEFVWDLRDRRGRKLANGTYFYTVDIDGQKINGKLAVLK
ncbi:MAG: T9SS type A sorting domain-containing protein, partial [Candidatus Muiribacteriota bacterium]